jgi:hypothetical protein
VGTETGSLNVLILKQSVILFSGEENGKFKNLHPVIFGLPDEDSILYYAFGQRLS